MVEWGNSGGDGRVRGVGDKGEEWGDKEEAWGVALVIEGVSEG